MTEGNFVDYVKLFVRSGNGGKGSIHLHREKYIDKGGPDGGGRGRADQPRRHERGQPGRDRQGGRRALGQSCDCCYNEHSFVFHHCVHNLRFPSFFCRPPMSFTPN